MDLFAETPGAIDERNRNRVEEIKGHFLKCDTIASVNATAVHYREEVAMMKNSGDPYLRTMAFQIMNLAGYRRIILSSDGLV